MGEQYIKYFLNVGVYSLGSPPLGCVVSNRQMPLHHTTAPPIKPHMWFGQWIQQSQIPEDHSDRDLQSVEKCYLVLA